jgi:hypothetical protein
MTSFFSPPKMKEPAPPPAPPEQDATAKAEMDAAAAAERKRRNAAQGRASTILTGGQGVNDNGAQSGNATKILLGQ